MAEEEFKGVSIRIREVSVSGIQARVEVNVKVADRAGVEPRTMLSSRTTRASGRSVILASARG